MCKILYLFMAGIMLLSCNSLEDKEVLMDEDEVDLAKQAAVVAVSITGSSGAYQFDVTVTSPDEGCDHYADWWEVMDSDSSLVYRRVLGHSHVDEQPFSRSGGPIEIEIDDLVFIRAHMSNIGYGSRALGGSIQDGFVPTTIPANRAAELSLIEPLPGDCAF